MTPRAHRRRACARAAQTVALLLAVAAGGARAAAPAVSPTPPAALSLDTAACRVEVTIEPPAALVGEQVRYRIRILRRPEVLSVRWLRTPTFPSLRAEWLPGRSGNPHIGNIGAGLLVLEERRALFPAMAGTLEIPEAQLGCTLADDEEFAATVPATVLRVDPVPAEGRPNDFAGVVGAIRVRSRVSSPLVTLGESFTVAISVTGAANVWAAAPPFDPMHELSDVDAYPRAPELEFERGERLAARRTFVWDLVPRRAGTLEIPPARVPYFDPSTRRYEQAAGPALRVTVLARAARGGDPVADPSPLSGAREAGEATRRFWGWRAFAGLLAVGAIAAAAVRVRRRSAPRRAAAAALEQAEQAAARGDREATARALAAALRAALASRMAGADTRAAEELAAQARTSGQPRGSALAAAAALLAALDRARFAAPGPERALLPDPETVRAAVNALASARSVL